MRTGETSRAQSAGWMGQCNIALCERDLICFLLAEHRTMESEKPKTIPYKRSRFQTQLPAKFLYSPSHCWIADQGQDLWRVGLTKFATRMLGEMVDHGFELEPGAKVEPGQIIGWVEGFKAISDLFCIAKGEFAGSNPALQEKVVLITKDCYGAGWLYLIKGAPDSQCVDVNEYQRILDKTIDKILEKQKDSD